MAFGRFQFADRALLPAEEVICPRIAVGHDPVSGDRRPVESPGRRAVNRDR
jgi:hypothetical protein